MHEAFPPASEQQGSSAVTTPPGVIAVDEGGEHVRVAAPQVERPDLAACPKCGIGLLYVIAYDAEALHERGNPLFDPKLRSGGSAIRTCFHCGHGDTVALSPSEAPPDPRQW